MLDREKYSPVKANVDIELVLIDRTNAALVGPLREERYVSQFAEQLNMGDVGYYAYLEGCPIGYGWVKHPGSVDYFFKIGEGARYLCRFFVCEQARGRGIYPALITALIEHEGETNRFYIARERGNVASERGLLKVGFKHVGEYAFLRGFKHTFNKRKLKGFHNDVRRKNEPEG